MITLQASTLYSYREMDSLAVTAIGRPLQDNLQRKQNVSQRSSPSLFLTELEFYRRFPYLIFDNSASKGSVWRGMNIEDAHVLMGEFNSRVLRLDGIYELLQAF